MGTSVVNISGVVYDGALTTPGSIQFNVANSNPTPPNLSASTISTATTTTLAVPAGSIGAFINSNASAGTITVGGQPWALIGAGFIPLPTTAVNLVVVTAAGFTGTVEVVFV